MWLCYYFRVDSQMWDKLICSDCQQLDRHWWLIFKFEQFKHGQLDSASTKLWVEERDRLPALFHHQTLLFSCSSLHAGSEQCLVQIFQSWPSLQLHCQQCWAPLGFTIRPRNEASVQPSHCQRSSHCFTDSLDVFCPRCTTAPLLNSLSFLIFLCFV